MCRIEYDYIGHAFATSLASRSHDPRHGRGHPPRGHRARHHIRAHVRARSGGGPFAAAGPVSIRRYSLTELTRLSARSRSAIRGRRRPGRRSAPRSPSSTSRSGLARSCPGRTRAPAAGSSPPRPGAAPAEARSSRVAATGRDACRKCCDPNGSGLDREDARYEVRARRTRRRPTRLQQALPFGVLARCM